jgi:uncharacterized protein (TIRG00374 family)
MSQAAAGTMESEAGLEAGPRTLADRLPGIGWAKLTSGGAAFILLTGGIFWYQFHRMQPGAAVPRWEQLRWGYLWLILLLLPVETLASAVRTWVVYRTLQPSVRLWTCLKAEWVNVALNTLTPAHLGGGPGQIYIFSREGVSVGRALTAGLLSFVGTMVGLLCIGLYSLLVSTLGAAQPLFDVTVWTLIAMSVAMSIPVMWPERMGLPAYWLGRLSGKIMHFIGTYRADVRQFLRAGKASFIWVGLLGLVFLLARAVLAFLCVRFLGIDTSSLRYVVEIQMALVFLLFFAPTPGGAGLAEGASLSLMAQIVPVGFAPYYNLLWRFSTLYLGALAGIVCLVRALVEDARGLIHHTR